MKRNRSFVFCTVMLGVLVAALFLGRQSLAGRQSQAERTASRENAYRENNIGVALLEQFKYKEGADAFRRALQIDPKLSLAHINLSIALYNVPDLPAAEREAKTAGAVRAVERVLSQLFITNHEVLGETGRRERFVHRRFF